MHGARETITKTTREDFSSARKHGKIAGDRSKHTAGMTNRTAPVSILALALCAVGPLLGCAASGAGGSPSDSSGGAGGNGGAPLVGATGGAAGADAGPGPDAGVDRGTP